MPKSKLPEEKETVSPKKTEIVPSERGISVPGPRRRPTSLVPYTSRDIWRDFDRVFEDFHSDFEDLLLPSSGPLARALSRMPAMETRVPYVDLDDRGKDYLLTA